MTGTYSLFAVDHSEPDDRRSAEASVTGRLRSASLAVATALAGVAVLVDEVVVWAGEPTGDPSSATVSAWYDAHVGHVLVGDLLWLAACGVLVAALWTSVARFPGVP